MLGINICRPLTGEHSNFTLRVECEIEEGTILPILGASGSGKTSFLRALAGLTSPGLQGLIRQDSKIWFQSSRSICLPAKRRGVSGLLQGWSLFPHWTVLENLNAALPKSGFRLGSRTKNPLIPLLVEAMGLGELQHCHPHQLSGGQVVRAGIAQMLLSEPRVFFLDEGLSALDPPLRSLVIGMIIELQKQWGFTLLLATHLWDQKELNNLPCMYIRHGMALMGCMPHSLISPPRLEA